MLGSRLTPGASCPPAPAAKATLEKEVEEHYRKHASKASRMGAADVAAEYQAIKADAAAKTAKISAECDALSAQLQVGESGSAVSGAAGRDAAAGWSGHTN